jgi:predicted outer membrane repeat protein
VTIDGGGGGRDMNLTCSGSSGNMTVSNLTFIRNCGNYQIGALRIAASSGGNISVSGCQFLSRTNTEGMGLEIAAGQNTTIYNCNFIGKTINTSPTVFVDGNGLNISGVTGNTFIYNSTMSGNFGGYGADITASAVLTVSNNVFQANLNAGYGGGYGGLYFYPSTGSQIAQVLVTANVFNGDPLGIGNQHGNGVTLQNFNALTFSGNIITGHQVGASIAIGLTATITGNTFNGNSDGGASLQVNEANVTGNTFSGNAKPGGYGGGASFYGSGTNIVSGNIFSGNSADIAGGAAYFGSQATILSNNTFSANSSHAPSANGGGGGGVYINDNGSVNVIGNIFTGNSCSGNQVGGALCVNGGTPTITGNTFNQNSADDGGGAIYATAPTITLSDNLVVNNSQSGASATGGGIFVNASSTLYMINNTIFGNSSGGGGGGASFQVSGLVELLNVYNNIIFGNSAVGNGADVYLAGSGQRKQFINNDVDGASSMYGVWDLTQNLIYLDPQFFDPVNGDYHFPGTSPCANAGTNGAPALPLADLDGNLRTNSLGQIDLGCYEFNTTATHPADTNAVFTITAGEYTSYAAAWKAGQTWTNQPNPGPNPISANYVTRAGYLMTNGGAYHNDGSSRPVNWKVGP